MQKIVAAVIGAGRIGRLHCENLLNHIPEIDLKAVSDPFIDEKWAQSKNIEVVLKDHQAILDDPEIDVVLICSRSLSHAELIEQAAEKGKHIFCEKPVALHPLTIVSALKKVDQANVKLQVGFNRRFDPSFAAVKDNVAKGRVGDVHLVKIISRDPSPPPLDYLKESGGLFLDMTIHDFDMARFLSNSEIKEVYALGQTLVNPEIAKYDDIDTALITLTFENDAIGIIENSRQAVYGYDQRIEVFGSKGSVSAGNLTPTSVKILTDNGSTLDKPLYFFLERYKDAFIEELKSFFKSIEENTPVAVSGEDGLIPVLIGLAAKRSIELHKPVMVEEIKKEYFRLTPSPISNIK